MFTFLGYTNSNVDSSLFVKHNGYNITTLLIYVDDVVLADNDEQ